MDQPHYLFESTGSEYLFSFMSEGTRGSIEKRVQFAPMNRFVFNLGFGDWNEELGDIDDLAVSVNGDMELVVATVISIICYFLTENTGFDVFLTGSTPARTRLYQIIINKYFDQIQPGFKVFAYRNGHWQRFEKNLNYESFIVSKLF